MADFKTHLQVGSAVGFLLSLGLQFIGLIHNFYMSIIVFFAATIGSFLPDMDSNSALPVRIIFMLYAYLAAGFAVYFLYQNGEQLILRILVPFLIFFAVFYSKKFFMKITTHRGIFHSIPAFILSFLLTLLITLVANINILEKFSIALAVSLGYLSHLVLDEIYSVNLFSQPIKKQKIKSFRDLFKTKKSYGTALDLGFNGKVKYPAFIAYLLIIGLIIFLFPTLKKIVENL